jgi:hypothetical protein
MKPTYNKFDILNKIKDSNDKLEINQCSDIYKKAQKKIREIERLKEKQLENITEEEFIKIQTESY